MPIRRHKITPFLWFDSQALDAARFYCKLFPSSKIDTITRRGGARSPVFHVTFTLDGKPFFALNGGPHFQLNEAFSLFVACKDQKEVDRLWNKLIADGGQESRCGWLKDKFGLSWQIIPDRLMQLLGDQDPARAQRATQAMLEMRKIIIKDLDKAAAGK